MAAPSRPIRVLLFVDNFDLGGSQQHVVQLVRGMKGHPRFDVAVGCLRRRGPLLGELGVPLETVREYPLQRFYGPRGIRQILRLRGDIKRSRIDIVHAVDLYAGMMCTAALSGLKGVRLVVSRRYEQLTTLRRHQLGEQWSYRRADAVVTNSRGIGERLMREHRVAPSKVEVIPNGIDVTRFHASNQPSHPPRQGGTRWRLGVVARLCEDKGLDSLLAATRILVNRKYDVELVLVGDGELRQVLERKAQHVGLGDRIVFAGAQTDIRPWVRSFDIALLPSLREGLPNALLEYLAMGRPVVATRVGAIPEVIDQPSIGLLVPPGNSEELAAAVEELIGDDRRREALGQAARRRAQEFDVTSMVEATCSMYDRVLSGNGRAQGKAQ